MSKRNKLFEPTVIPNPQESYLLPPTKGTTLIRSFIGGYDTAYGIKKVRSSEEIADVLASENEEYVRGFLSGLYKRKLVDKKTTLRIFEIWKIQMK